MPFIPDRQQTGFRPDATFPKEEPASVRESFASRLAGAVSGFKAGVAKGAANTLTSSIGLVNRGLDATAGRVADSISGAFGKGSVADSEGYKRLEQDVQNRVTEMTTPKGAAETTGFIAEQVGEFLVPAGAPLKAATATEAAVAASKVPKLAKLAGFGARVASEAALGAGQTAAQGGDSGDVKTAGILSGIFPIAAKVLKTVGKTIAEAVIPTSKQEAGLLQAYKAGKSFMERVLTAAEGKPVTAASTAFEKGLAGTEAMIGVQAKRATSKLWDKLIGPALKSAKASVDMPAFFSEVKKDIIEKTPELSRQKALLEGLEALIEDYKKTKSVSLEQLQKFKEGWAQLVPDKYYRGKPIGAAFSEVKAIAANNARKVIYSTLGEDVRQAYLDYGNLKGLQELGQVAMTGGKFKGGAGSFITALKDMALVPAGTFGGQTIYKLGRGIEILGRPGIRTVQQLFEQN